MNEQQLDETLRRTIERPTLLNRIIDEAVTRAFHNTASLASEKFAEELAQEAMNEPGFREQWRAVVRETAQRALEAMTRPVQTTPKNGKRKRKKA